MAVYPEHKGSYFRYKRFPDLIGGDDLALAMAEGISFELVCAWLRQYGTVIEAIDWTPRPCTQIVYMSHTLRSRYVQGFGDFLCAAGNLPKLKSSVNWIKRSETLTFQESCVAHLIGLRLCLFPWALEFEEVDNILSTYLKTIVLTPFIREVLSARLTERQLAILHTRCEGFVFSPAQKQVLKGHDHRLFKARQEDLARKPIYQSMTQSSNRKIDQILDSLEKRSSLSSDGRAWLIAACDIFHDTDIVLAGYPDVNTCASVVQLIKKQLQIQVPVGLTTQNWDCSIVLFPTMASITYGDLVSLDPSGVVISSTGATAFNTGGLTVNSGPSGTVLWPNAANPQIFQVGPANQYSSTSLDVREFIKGNMRIIGMGFEVVNTTSALNKQGQVTAYRMPTNPTTSVIYPAAADLGFSTAVPVVVSRFPPGTIADAQLLYGTRSWAAAEGSYTMSRQNSVENPFVRGDWVSDMYTVSDATYGINSQAYTPNTAGSQEAGKFLDLHAPYDLSGVHYTGLSNTTTLTINVRWLVERSPGPNEQDLVVLATPSSAYDPLALELYTQCMQRMPAGVMLSENPLGEWFRKALSAVEKWAPKVGDFIGNVIPGAKIIGAGIGTGAKVAGGIIRRAGKKKPLPDIPPKQPQQGSASQTGARAFNYANASQRKNRKPLPAIPR
jgi:hypothetical protein